MPCSCHVQLPSWLDFMSNGLNMCVNNGVALARIPSYHMQSVRRAMEDRLAPYTNVCVVKYVLFCWTLDGSATTRGSPFLIYVSMPPCLLSLVAGAFCSS